jgi:hypothetical protein
MTIRAGTGNVGIGTTSPARPLEILGSGDTLVRITGGSGNAKGIEFYKGSGTATQLYNVSDDLRIFTNAAERMRIDDSGNVGIGTSSPAKNLEISDSSGAELRLTNSSTSISQGDLIGALEFYNSDTSGVTPGVASSIKSVASTVGGANGELVFSTIPGASEGDDATEAMRIDASGNLLVGTTGATAGYRLKVEGGNVLLYDGSGGAFATINHSGNEMSIGTTVGASGFLTFQTGAGSERMRIDSSGNLLVGTTTADQANNSTVANTGIALRPSGSGALQVSRDGAQSATFNRLTSDGDIVQFRKDGSSVGSIGVNGGSATIGSASSSTVYSGLRFRAAAGAERIEPWNVNTNAAGDNAINLGEASNRFKNLYLSGGVYLGGTGAANLLDEYETGTWTPVIVGGTTAGTGTYTAQEGIYTKVGDLVTVACWLDWSAHTGTGAFFVGGLPFSSSAAVNLQAGSTYASNFDAGTSATQLIAYVSGSASIFFRGFINNATRAVTNINSSGQLGVTISYRAA